MATIGDIAFHGPDRDDTFLAIVPRGDGDGSSLRWMHN